MRARPQRGDRGIFERLSREDRHKPSAADAFRRESGVKVAQPQSGSDRIPERFPIADYMLWSQAHRRQDALPVWQKATRRPSGNASLTSQRFQLEMARLQ